MRFNATGWPESLVPFSLVLLVFLTSIAIAVPINDSPDPKPELVMWNQSYAEVLVEMSRAAYCNASLIARWECNLCVPGFNVSYVTPDNKEDTQGYVGYHEGLNQIMVAFRGSQDLKNWMEDLNFIKLDANYSKCLTNSSIAEGLVGWKPKCVVHRGFWDAWEVVRDGVIKSVEDLRTEHPNAVIAVTGHSLGAAISAFCALDLQMTLGNVVLYNFGEPRVGNWYFAQFINSQFDTYFRITHNKDPVPHLPPLGRTPLLSLNFFHERTEVWERGEELYNFVQCDGSGEDQSCSDQVDVFSLVPTDHSVYMGRTMHDCAPPPVPPLTS